MPHEKCTLIIAATLLVACGGGSSSSSKTPIGSQVSTTTSSGDCQVVNNEIVIDEGKSCSINATTQKKYALIFKGVAKCSNGKIITTALTGPTVSVNGLTIKCK